jgi:hypothetical protein
MQLVLVLLVHLVLELLVVLVVVLLLVLVLGARECAREHIPHLNHVIRGAYAVDHHRIVQEDRQLPVGKRGQRSCMRVRR